jgi:uncharacterized membrane protein YphA (DoxX/SURF4 family)
VSAQHHLTKRSGVFYYRRRVPQHLVESFGKTAIQFSLHTSSLKEAKKLRALEDLKWTTQFETAEKSLNGKHPTAQNGSPVAGEPLSSREVIRLVQEYVEQTDRHSLKVLMGDPPESEQQKSDIKADIEVGYHILRDRDDPRADEIIYRVGEKILRPIGMSIDDPRVPRTAFAEFVRRAVLELDRRKLARLDDDHRYAFFDHQFDPTHRPGATFGALATQFIKLKEEDAAENHTSQKWLDKQHAQVALLCEIIGKDTPIQKVDYDECMRVRSVVARMPANRSKIYSGLSLDEAIKRAEAEHKPRLLPFTQERYLASLREIVHVPFPDVAIWISISIHLLGGLGILLGFKIRSAAAVLFLFCLGTAFGILLPAGGLNNMIHFYKNLVMAGGFLYVLTYGAGAMSIDGVDKAKRSADS